MFDEEGQQAYLHTLEDAKKSQNVVRVLCRSVTHLAIFEPFRDFTLDFIGDQVASFATRAQSEFLLPRHVVGWRLSNGMSVMLTDGADGWSPAQSEPGRCRQDPDEYTKDQDDEKHAAGVSVARRPEFVLFVLFAMRRICVEGLCAKCFC